MKYSILFSLLFAFSAVFSQTSPPSEEVEAIKSMCGCYEVDFNFVETFSPNKEYEIHEAYHSKAEAEWVFIEEESEGHISLQHLLIVGPDRVIKHWKQDWIYENTEFFVYDHDFRWTRGTEPKESVTGEWTQKVYQVDDCIRYEASAPWIKKDGVIYWESEVDAPLPRREITKRSDYNVMHRRNRQELTDYGWLHEQDNKKIIRKKDEDQLLVMEKGYNTYTKVEDSKCKAAKKWWKENREYWKLVEAVWQESLKDMDDVQMVDKVDGEKRYEKLFTLQYEYDAKKPEETKKKIKDVLDLYFVESSSSNTQKLDSGKEGNF